MNLFLMKINFSLQILATYHLFFIQIYPNIENWCLVFAANSISYQA